jgi:DNA invertase Pin-like site-specific DNA recombinase
VRTQPELGTDHAIRRGWTVAATFKDGGYSAFEEISRDGIGELIVAIEAGQVDVVIVRNIDRLTRNLTDWNAFEKACVRHGVRHRPIPARPGPVHGGKVPITAG